MNSIYLSCLILTLTMFVLSACSSQDTRIIVITSTFPPANVVSAANPTEVIVATSLPPVATLQLSPAPQVALSNPTPNATRPPIDIPASHTVQAGDTLSGIAARYNISLDAIMQVNEGVNPNILSIGQIINLPDVPEVYSPNFKIIPDSRLVRAPRVNQFNIEAFVAAQTGYIRIASDEVDIRLANGAAFPRTLTAAQILERVSLEYSVDPRLLLALLEFRAGFLSNPQPLETLIDYPLVSADFAPNWDGLYNQLAYTANELNRAYYGWKGRNFLTLSLTNGSRILFDPELNPASIAVQYFLSIDGTDAITWQAEVGLSGFYSTYVRYFGDPFADAIEPLVPNNLQQPLLGLPFESGVEWRFTGGPHGGWGTGSAWSSLDFAPSEERPSGVFCYTSDVWVTALASGIIARSGEGAVVLDLDGDGDESTGWTIMYLHLASDDMPAQGTRVNTGDRIGHPSCAGGISNATHLHIGRRYNGEWIPADCQACLPEYQVPTFVMGNWRVIGLEGQYYQGFMQNGTTQIQAEQGRETNINRISG